MIISTGLRTDIINHYSPWMFERFREGYVFTRNPLFPKSVKKYRLTPELVDAVIFCSKNYEPALDRLHEITNRYRTFFHYTLTAYGRDIEPNIPDEEMRIKTLITLSKMVGRERLVWRFEPVFFSEDYPLERITETFERIAARISPYVRGCIVAFLEPFYSMHTRMPQASLPDNQSKRAFIERILAVAKKYNLCVQSCAAQNDYEEMGLTHKGCYTLDIIGEANGCVFQKIKHTGNRRGCLCVPVRDIGWYDSCPNLCKYCNANRSAGEVKSNVLKHDPHSPLLIGALEADDELTDGNQVSFLSQTRQISLFDL